MNGERHLLQVLQHKHLNTQDRSWQSSCTHLYLYTLTELQASISCIWVRIWLLSTFLPLVKYKPSWMPKNFYQFHCIYHTYKIQIMDTTGFWTALEIRNLQLQDQFSTKRSGHVSAQFLTGLSTWNPQEWICLHLCMGSAKILPPHYSTEQQAFLMFLSTISPLPRLRFVTVTMV